MSAWWWVWCVVAASSARELDPAACARRFDVQRDKIIRTEESRDMGARYLSELDVGARSECLRLCCETDLCDVFVYEEKSPGSCYLFNCGPPEDFRCKFTAHGNFSSGVLALSRRLAELQDQEALATHEHDLATLRTAKTSTSTSTSSTSTTSLPTSPPRPPPPPPQPAPSTSQTTSVRCSRYQFACHSGGECIAVYNACDGVPQCADGSDEAPELGCPAAPPAVPALPPAPPAAPALPPSPPRAEPSDRWPHRLMQAQPPVSYSDSGSSSHIFSHKGGLLTEPESYGGAYDTAPWPRRLSPHQPVSNMGGMSGMEGMGWGFRPEWEADPRRAWPVPPPPQLHQEMMYLPPKTMPELPAVYSGQQTLRDGPKKGPAPPRPTPVSTDPPSPPVKEKTSSQNTTPKKIEKQETATRGAATAGAAHEWAQDEHDGLSEHPPAAVLLLVLGVLMTGALVALGACRARAARRRRGRKPGLAHDADYLVNGMYL